MVKTSTSKAGVADSIPGWGAKTPHACGQKAKTITQKQYCHKFNKDFKNGPPQKQKKKKQLTHIRSDFSLHTSFYSYKNNTHIVMQPVFPPNTFWITSHIM